MYRLVDTEIWDDAWYSDLAPEAKFLFLWFLTNRRTNSVGAYEITLRQVAFETGLKQDTVERLLTGLHPKVQWWPEHCIVWVKNFYGRQNNWGKAEINARKVAADLPRVVRDAVCKEYPSLSLNEEAPSMPHASPLDQQNGNVTEQYVTETEQNIANAGAPARKARRAVPIPEDWEPDEGAVAWARQAGFSDDEVLREVPRFRNHHRSKGNVFKDVGLAWRNWMDNSRSFGSRASPITQPKRHGAMDFVNDIGREGTR